MRITKENTIGLIIDIQERLVPAMFENESLVKKCLVLIEGLKELSVQFLVTQQYTKGLGETIESVKTLIPDFSYFEKRDFSCCDEPTVMEKLASLNAKNIIICGIESHVCVLQTAVNLKAAGYNPVVVMDCTSSRTPQSIDLAKERFRLEGILMTSCESILFELTRSAAVPEFKAISKLVK